MKPASAGPSLTRGPISSSIYSLMLPMMAGMLAMISYSVVDTYFVSRLGTLQLAAVSFSFPVNFIISAITMGLAIGTSSVASRFVGAGERRKVQRIATHSVMLGVCAGGLLIVIGINTIDPVFRLLGADHTTLPFIHQYMRIYYWGGIFLVAPMIGNSVLRATGDAKTPATIMLVSAILNAVLDPILIFGLFGFPRLELQGAALATVLANVGTMMASLSILYFREHLIVFRSHTIKLVLDSWGRILHIGLPSMTSSLIVPMTTAFVTSLVSGYGQAAVAGFGLASRVEGFALLAIMALGASVTPFVGQNYGAGEFQRVRQGVHFCYRFALAYGLIVATVLLLSSNLITTLFVKDAGALQAANWQLRILPWSHGFLGLALVANGAFNAMGKPVRAMFVSLSRTLAVLYVPLAWLLSSFFGLIGIFVGGCIANLIAGGIGFFWLRQSLRGMPVDSAPVATEEPAAL